jgi:hypothetical protein
MTTAEILRPFLIAQPVLQNHIVDDRLTLDNDLAVRDLNTISGLCGLLTERTPEETPVQCALVRLCATTASVLTTAVVDAPDNALIVAEWRLALDEYEALS